MEIAKHEATEKLQVQAEYNTAETLPSLAKEINTNTFPVLMKNGGWSFSLTYAQSLLWYKVKGFLLSFSFCKNC